MNLPNKLTLLQSVYDPVFRGVYADGPGRREYGKYIALAIFIVASLTDMLDGKIARKQQPGDKLWKIYGSAGG